MSEKEASPPGEIFDVEFIEKKRIDARGVRYYIKWKDYPGSLHSDSAFTVSCFTVCPAFPNRSAD